MNDLERHLTPIRSGVTPSTGGGLSRERAADLRRALADLHRARQAAWLEIRGSR